MMIEAPRLLKDLKRHLKSLEDDIRARLGGDADLQATLRQEWQAAQSAGRTARTEADWLDEETTQAAAHWILACVFLRFIEDNHLVERPWLAGPGDRLTLARDRHEAYFRAHPHESGREYLMACFREAEALPGVGALFDEAHNPLWRLPVSGDGADALVGLFQRVDPDRGTIDHDFTDPDHGTRFLGDLYQDLSEAAKKRYALLQTPEFVERFILDRTLKPAIDEFGWAEVRLLDPACGSGHFLLDAFARLFDLRVRHDMNSAMPGIAQAALDQVAGVDINPFAVAIARFRLLVAALKACSIARLKDAPDFRINVATGDSLLHGRRFDRLDLGGAALHTRGEGVRHFTHAEDAAAVDRLLGRQYHVVVGNPPYITAKDEMLNRAYRERYRTCRGKYLLSVPFTQRCFELALVGQSEKTAGYIGLIVASAFMRREFGKSLVERFFPLVDLTCIVDTSRAHIPGHGTPTVMIFGRNRPPIESTVRALMGIRGEATKPVDPSRGSVWLAILAQVDQSPSESEFLTAADIPRSTLASHPWSLGGGGATDIKQAIEKARNALLGDLVDSIGFMSIPGDDDVFVSDDSSNWVRAGISEGCICSLIDGESIRDWTFGGGKSCIFPYDEKGIFVGAPSANKHFWTQRSVLRASLYFHKTKEERGLDFRSFAIVLSRKFTTPYSIVFSNVSTHNHFVLSRGGLAFNSHSPVIKLFANSDDREYFHLLYILNSSTGCFWMKNVFHNKGGGGIGGGLATEEWEQFYEFTGNGLKNFPVKTSASIEPALLLDRLGQELSATLPKAVLARSVPTPGDLNQARKRALSIRRQMIAWQEELDWRCYRLYGLIDEDLVHPEPPEIDLGERAFEIVMARQMAEGTLETTWFERHGSNPITEIPAHWPADYRALIERRIARIEIDKWIGLIERPEYKRRWQGRPWAELEKEALRDWLLDRLEDCRHWDGAPLIRSVNQLAERARTDAGFMTVAALYTGRPDFTISRLVAELVEPESVPFLPVLRYSADGLRKRAAWERTWDLQRREDAGEDVGIIPVPPKYKQKDFQKSGFWRLRGGLDVPKERFISYPGCARNTDGSLPLAWAGYDHRQQAEALWTCYQDRKEREGWQRARLEPLLAGLADLLPWLKQWHNDLDPATGVRFGDFIADVLAEEARGFGLTLDQLKAWSPPAAPTRRGRKSKKIMPLDDLLTEHGSV